MLKEALALLDRSKGGTYGNKFSEKSLTGMMAHWTKQADIEPGYTLHGLRKTYAAMMIGESGATYQQQKDSLGHTTAQQVARYGKSIEKRKTTIAATRLLEAKIKKQRLRAVTQ
jgi:integrase